MFHHILSEFMGTALMIVFGVGVHCDDVLKRTKYAGSGHMFAITTWAFGISVVLFVFGGVCINPAMKPRSSYFRNDSMVLLHSLCHR